MTVELIADGQHVRENFAAHIYPFLERLIGALRVLKDGYVDEKIILFLGAPECELCLSAEAGSTEAALRINLWRDSGRSKFTPPRTLFSIQAKRDEIVAPFVAALKQLRTSVNDAEFLREYGSPFPTREYDALMENS